MCDQKQNAEEKLRERREKRDRLERPLSAFSALKILLVGQRQSALISEPAAVAPQGHACRGGVRDGATSRRDLNQRYSQATAMTNDPGMVVGAWSSLHGFFTEKAMRAFRLSLLLPMLLLAACAAMPGSPDSALKAAIDHPGRSAADRERDARDQPQAVLQLAGFAPGMVIADIFGGGGYYSEILSRLVGPSGQVRLINNQPYHDYAKADAVPRFANDRLPNVSYEINPSENMKLGVASLDGALIIMSYHDLYVADDAGGWPAIDAAQFIDQIVTALKPGGVLLIVDHSAETGTGKSAAQTLHRIDEAFAIADLKAHGLDFTGSIPALRNPEDKRTLGVMNPAIRGKTDRFVHVYRKP